MLPKVIEYQVKGNVLAPLVFMDMSLLMDEYDSIMLNVKQVRHNKQKKRGA
ncbi:hypothetical protein D3C74_159750 [compost metagenome]